MALASLGLLPVAQVKVLLLALSFCKLLLVYLIRGLWSRGGSAFLESRWLHSCWLWCWRCTWCCCGSGDLSCSRLGCRLWHCLGFSFRYCCRSRLCCLRVARRNTRGNRYCVRLGWCWGWDKGLLCASKSRLERLKLCSTNQSK